MPDFTEVYREYFAGVYRYVLALCGDPSLAEEITQETFFRSLAAIDGFRGDCPSPPGSAGSPGTAGWTTAGITAAIAGMSRRRAAPPVRRRLTSAGRRREPPWRAWTACRSPTARCCGSGLWGASASGTLGRRTERPRPGPGSPASGPGSD